MSLELVGREVIPNTYISKIILSQGAQSFHGEAHVYIRDHILEDLGKPLWSDNKQILNRLKFMFMSIEGEALITSVSSGYYNLMDLMKLQADNPFQVHTQYRDVSVCKKISLGVNIFYKTVFKFTISNFSQNQAIFCCAYMEGSLSSMTDSSIDRFMVDLKGPTASEYVIRDSDIAFSSNVFIKQNGQQYAGPVHYHPSTGYMEGAVHSDESHGTLRRESISNFKIVNNINFTLKPKTAVIKPRYSPTTRLWGSFKKNGGVAGVFGVNYENILIRKTKYGHALMNLNNSDLQDFIDNIKIKLFAIIRHKINKKHSKVLDSKQIVRSFTDNMGAFKEAFVVSKTKDKSSVVFVDDLRSSSGLEIIDHNEIFTEDVTSETLKSAIKQVPLKTNGSRGIRFYQFDDNDVSFGDYTYELDLKFRDPTIEYVDNMIKEARDGLSSIKNYLNRILSKDNYDHHMGAIRSSFVDEELLFYGNNVESAPWIKVVKNYSKYNELFYELTQEQVDFLLYTAAPKVHPKTATLNSIKSFIEHYQKLLNKLYKHFDISTTKLTSSRSSSESKSFKDPRTNMIDISYKFKNHMHYEDTFAFYNYFSGLSEDDEMLYLSKETVGSRMALDRQQFGTNDTLLSNPIVSPISVQRNNDIIQLDYTNFSDDYIRKLNAFFRNVVIEKIPEEPPPFIEEVTVEPEPELDIHIPVTDILGEDTKLAETVSEYDICGSKFGISSEKVVVQEAAWFGSGMSATTMPDYGEYGIVPEAAITGVSEPTFEKSRWVGKIERFINVLVNYYTIHKIQVLDGFIDGYLEDWRDLTPEDLSGDKEFICKIKHIGPGWEFDETALQKATKLPTSVNKYFYISNSFSGVIGVDDEAEIEEETMVEQYSARIMNSLSYDLHLTTSNIIKQNITVDSKMTDPVEIQNLNDAEDITELDSYATNILGSFLEDDAGEDIEPSAPADSFGLTGGDPDALPVASSVPTDPTTGVSTSGGGDMGTVGGGGY